MLKIDNLTLAYGNEIVVKNLSFEVEKGSITTIIGPNGCGKSTLLKAIANLKKSKSGDVFLHSKKMSLMDSKKLAKKIAILPQSQKAPEDFTTRDLVGYGRYPHLDWTGRLTKKDQDVIDWAIKETRLDCFQHRTLSTMSGGEKQRAWVAMALAQQPEILLLDEPTTYLDICHQYELLELITRLNLEMNITIVMVLHDINQAARYSDHIIVMKEGQIYQEGQPYDIINKNVIEDVFHIRVKVLEDHESGCPYIIPESHMSSIKKLEIKALKECS